MSGAQVDYVFSVLFQVDAVTWLIPSAALAVAVATFALGMREFRRGDLVRRINECETDRVDLRRQLRDLRDENIELMRRVMRLENGHS